MLNQSTPQDYLRSWLEDLKRQSKADLTIYCYQKHVTLFINWCKERDIHQITAVSKSILESYARYLSKAPLGQKGQSLKPGSQQSRLIPVRLFFNWCSEERLLVYNPAKELILPKEQKYRITDTLSVPEVEALLSTCNLKTDIGIRDRAIMEILYSTGIRRQELQRLDLSDVDFQTGILNIRHGKGGKQRLAPIGDRALDWIQQYLIHVRPELETTPNPALFISTHKKRLGNAVLREVITKAKKKYGIRKWGNMHLIRHTMATLMLKNGADIRIIQEILGHSKIDTTMMYTKLDISYLKKIHQNHHPAEKEADKSLLF